MNSRPRQFAQEMFRKRHGAEIDPSYLTWRTILGEDGQFLAVLGLRPAGEGRLFLEDYLTDELDRQVSLATGRTVARTAIVEIGCLAAVNVKALITLWSSTAQTLSGDYEVAVATLTMPMRSTFQRLGLPLFELCEARPERLRDSREHWGR